MHPGLSKDFELNDFEEYLKSGERDFAQAWSRLGVSQHARVKSVGEGYRMPNVLKIETPDFTAFLPIMKTISKGRVEVGSRLPNYLPLVENMTIWTNSIEKTKLWLAKQMFKTAMGINFTDYMWNKTEWETMPNYEIQLPLSADYDTVFALPNGTMISPVLSALVTNELKKRNMTKRNPKVRRIGKPAVDSWWRNYEWETEQDPNEIEYEAKWHGGRRREISAYATDTEADININIKVRMSENQFGERVFVEFWPLNMKSKTKRGGYSKPDANDVNDKQRAWLKDKGAYIFDYGAGLWALKDSGLKDSHPDIIDIGNYIRSLEGFGPSNFDKTRNNPKVRRKVGIVEQEENSWTNGTPWRMKYGADWLAVDALYAKTGLFLKTTYPRDHKYLAWNDDAWRPHHGGLKYRRRHQGRGERVLTHWNGMPLIHRYPRFLERVREMKEWEIDSPDYDLSLPAPWWAKTGTKISDFEREKSFTIYHEWIIPFEWNGRLFDFKMENNDYRYDMGKDDEEVYLWKIEIELMNGEKMTGKQWNRMFKDLNLDFIKWEGHVLHRPGNYTNTEKVAANNRRKFDKVFAPSWVDDEGKPKRPAKWSRNPIQHHGEMLNDDADLAPLQDVMLSKNAEIEIESGWYPNYGHFLDFINIADDMAWDIYAPGFEGELKPGKYRVKNTLGALMLKNGNHKVCVELDLSEYNADLAVQQIFNFKKWYEDKTGMKMTFKR